MSDRQFKRQLGRLRRHQKKSNRRTSTTGNGARKERKCGLPNRFTESGSEARKELLRGKL